jgi:uncharacterized membrane protein
MTRYKRKKRFRKIAIGAIIAFAIIALFGSLYLATSTAKAKQAVESKGFKGITLVSKVPMPMLLPGTHCGLVDYAGFVFEVVDATTDEKKTVIVCGNPLRIGKITDK